MHPRGTMLRVCESTVLKAVSGAENIGYIIPTPVVNHFLEDLGRNSEYTGFGALGIQCQALMNPQLRKSLHMASDMTGVLINKVEPIAAAHGILQRNDVLLSIDDVRLANDGSCSLPLHLVLDI